MRSLRVRWLRHPFLFAYVIVLLASHAWIYWRHSPDAYGQPHLNSPAARAAIDPESDRTAGFVAVPRYQPDGPINAAPPVIIHYEDWHRSQADKKEVLILLHGSPGRVGSFRSLVPELNKDLYAIAPDLPGFGRSTREIPNYGIRAQARYMLAFMDALEIQSAHFWAYSMSSGIVLEMSRMAPDRIESAIFYGGIGIQAGEGSGDYTIEHLKYRAGYVCFYLLPELIPHFGLIPDRSYRHSFIRNFMDTDQRPLRTALENFPAPLLILHGVRDPLVLPWVAEEHHRLAPHSQLVMLPGSHFLIFHTDGVHVLAAETNRFLRELQQSHSIKEFTHYEARPDAEIELPLDLSIEPGSAISAWTRLLGIISGTFVSEDLTCISVGLLIRARQLDFFTGLLGCYVGIFLGDVGLYFLGVMVRLGLLRWRKAAALLQHDRLQGLADRFDREGWKLIIMSRFLPGTRFPVYTGAGLIGGHATRLILFALIAGLLWTPLLVLLTAFYGAGILELANQVFGVGWLALACTLIVLYLMVRAALMLLSTEGRYRLWARLERLRRPEFWPPLLFYAPLIPVVAYLIVRYRGFESVAAVNPGIEDGGFIGESKAAILKRLPAEVVPDFVLIPVGTVLERMQAIDTHIRKRGWTFPLIVKPDAAQRGVGLRLVRNRQEIEAYLPDHPLPLVLQVYHPGPYEAGVFYVRHPNEVRGRIFSITDKVFPILIGDGKHTLRELIYRHKRFRLQADVFCARHAQRLDTIPAAGEAIRLTVAGNHFQGTLFRDGAHLITPELADTMDAIARAFPGFYFGRFDVRYSDVDAFKAGRDLAIIELNGGTSESTNIYDPEKSIRFLYATLFRQWILLFQIGYANRRRGQPVKTVWRLLMEIVYYLRRRTRSVVAD